MRPIKHSTVIDFYEDDEPILLCGECKKYGSENKLGVRIIQKGEERPPDWEDWLQCHVCGQMYNKNTDLVERVSELEPFTELLDSPAQNRFIAMHAGKRGKRIIDRTKSREYHKDSDIAREQRQVGIDNVHIIQDTSV